MPADSLKLARNMLTQKVVGYQSESTTLVSASGNSYAGLFCSGKLFRGIGLCKEGIFIEAHGERQVVKQGKFNQVWLRITNDCIENRHQFYYSADGEHYEPAGEAFPMRAGYWKGIRVGLFCYGPMRAGYWKGIRVGLFCYGPSGQAAFDFFEQRVAP